MTAQTVLAPADSRPSPYPSATIAPRSQEPDVSWFEQRRRQPPETLSAEQVAYHRHVLTTHANDPTDGTCRICHKRSCPHWRHAYDRLAAAGHTMAEPDRWLTSPRPAAPR